VERVRAAGRVGAAFGDHVGDPVRRVGRHQLDLGAALGAELVEKPAQRVRVAARGGPHQPPLIVIDHHGQVVVVFLVADLIDPDPAQPGQPVGPGGGVRSDPGDDRPHGAPGDPHQRHHRGLRAGHRQPGNLIVERSGVPGIVARPRHRRHHHPVLTAAHPGRVGLHHRPLGA
jgi:hypothetical protein